jgi:hypothetical protein
MQYVADCLVEATAGIRNETEHFQWERLMEWHLAARWSFWKCNFVVNVMLVLIRVN